MFEQVTTAPADPILGLTEAFRNDPNPEKINLSVGVYQDEHGRTPVLEVVREAERRLLEAGEGKAYKPIQGDPAYGKAVQKLLFGAEHQAVAEGRVITAHTPGGTGALRVAGDYLAAQHGAPAIWLSEPTWPNHPGVFKAAGLSVRSYPYFDAGSHSLNFPALMEGLKQVGAGDVVLLHGGCHNPTGADPSVEQWGQIGRLLNERGALPLVDFAYQGFADGVEVDAAGLRALAAEVDEMIICSSFSKNFGLYCERTGAVSFVAGTAEAASAVMSQLKAVIRTNYSNPPAHGGAIVTTVLGDEELHSRWEVEVASMRDRINAMRHGFAQTMKQKGAKVDFGFITRQRGMFSFSGLNREQVSELREKHAIYIVGSGRINVAGLTPDNLSRLGDAVMTVL